MSTVVQNLIALLFPKSHSLPLKSLAINPRIRQTELSLLNKDEKSNLQWVWVGCRYTKEVDQIMTKIKRGHEFSYIDDLTQVLIYQINNNIEASHQAYNSTLAHRSPVLNNFLPDIITFTPFDKIRKQKLGFYTPEKISQKLGQYLNIKVYNLLTRKQSPPQQGSLSKKDRLINLQNTFTYNSQEVEKLSTTFTDNIKTIWLIDDICTTGSTIYYSSVELSKVFPHSQIYAITISGN
jgi:predicted amidophosphoribosyltransferase